MPTYVFKCEEGHEFEEFYKTIGSYKEPPICPECGKKSKKQISRSAFSGFIFERALEQERIGVERDLHG